MRFDRSILALTAGGLMLALASGCAAPAKTARPSTDILDGAVAAAPVAAPVTTPEPVAAAPVQDCSLPRIFFAFDSAMLDAPAREGLKTAAACLERSKPSDVVVEGHCDERGTAAYNMALGNRRANAVKSYLTDRGGAAPIEPISFGKELPLVRGEGAGEEIWSQNRRAELKLPGERRTDGTLVAGR